MSEHDAVRFFLQLSTMLAVGLACGQLLRRFQLPAVLGELAGGILLGPTVFGALATDGYAWLFPSAGAASLGRDAVTRLGLLLFLFVAGLEVNLAQVWRRGPSIVWTSLLGIAAPFTLGAGLALALPGLWGSQAGNNLVLFALFLGTALSISALPVIARILIDLDLLKRDLGVIVMAAATLDDLVGWTLFAVILASFAPAGAGSTGGAPGPSLLVTLGLVPALALVSLRAGRRGGPRALHWAQARLAWPGGLIGPLVIAVLVAGALAEAIGIHAIFGAFLVGVALSPGAEKRHEAHAIVHHFVLGVLAPLYFVSVGLRANFATSFDPLLVGVVLLVACIGKVAGAGLGAWLGKLPPREALAVGFGMNARGAMGIVLASVALEHRLIDERVFVALVVMALVTSLLSGPVMQRLLLRSSVVGRQ